MALYDFNSMILTNFFLFNKTTVPLSNQGLVLVRGRFENKRNSNGAGKSLLFAPLHMLTQGTIPTGKMSKANTKEINIKLQTFIRQGKQANDYSIKFIDNKYEIKRDLKTITPHKSPEALKLIRSLFPDETTFNAITFVSQYSPLFASLIGGTPAIRAKLIESFMDQSKIGELKQIFKDKIDKIKEVKDKIDKYEMQIDVWFEELANLKKVSSKELNLVKADKKRVAKTIEETEEKLDKERAEDKKYNDYKEVKLKLFTKLTRKEIKLEIKKLSKDLEKIESQIDIYENTGDTIKQFIRLGKPKFYSIDFNLPSDILTLTYINDSDLMPENKIKLLIKIYKELKDSIIEQKRLLSKFEKIKNIKVCPTCDTKLKPKKIKDLILNSEKIIKADKKKVQHYKKQLGYAKVLVDLKDEFTLHEITNDIVAKYNIKILSKLKNKRNKLIDRKEYLQGQLPVLKFLNSIDATKLRSRKTVTDDLRKELADLRGEYIRLTEMLIQLKDSFGKRYKLLTKSKQISKIVVNKKESIEKDSLYLPLINKVLSSRDFRSDVLFDFCETIILEWNKYASDLFKKKVIFSLSKEQGYPAFQFSYGSKAPKYDIRFLSGGEKKRLIACMIPSILMLNPSPTNILILDELDANLDTSGVQAILNFLPVIQENFSKTSLFFLTAKDDLKHVDYKNWLVNRKGNNTKLFKE